ncbi:DNA-binding protein [Priestia aryabhattai]|nr:DNA-binding protein [Priestia aryabhattai]
MAKQVKVSAMTIKRNCQTYKDFINVKQGEKNKYLIDSSSLPVFLFIAKMRNKRSLQSAQILELLEEEGFPKIYDEENINTSKQQTEQSLDKQGIVPVQDIESMVAKRVQEELKKHEHFLSEWTLKQEEQQRKFQEELLKRLDDRDQKLMSSIRELQESKLEIAASIEEPKKTPNKKWWEFWK